jgi:hypothetical protein
MNYTIIILAFIIILMLYVGYLYYTNKSLVSGVVSLNNTSGGNPVILWNKLDSPGSKQYHYKGWFFINNSPVLSGGTIAEGTQLNYLFSRNNGSNNLDLALVLYGTSLVAYTGTVNNINTTSGMFINKAGHTKELMRITDNYPIQKWVYIVINVNNTIVEAYLNGKLVKTLQITEFPGENQKSGLHLGNSINGYVTKFERIPKPVSPDEVWKGYTSGNGLSMFTNLLNGYNASFSVYSTAEDVKKYTLF